MPNLLKRFNNKTILLFSGVLLIALFLSFGLTYVKPTIALAVLGGISIFIISFVSTEAALYILIFSMLLGPEFIVGEIAGKSAVERGVTLRLDDFLLVLIGFSWFAKSAIYKELGLFLKTPLNKPIFYYIAAMALSTAFGIMFGRVQIKTGFFFVLKYIEYFVVYFMVLNNIRDRKQIKYWIIAIMFTCAVVGIIGIYQIPGGDRVTAPFEGEVGEPNTLAGYLLLILSIVAGLILTTESRRNKVLLGVLALLIIIPFLATQSRGSYVAIVPMCFAFLMLSEKKAGIAILMAILIILGPFLIPSFVKKRVIYTYTQPTEAGQIKVGGIKLDTSTSARVYAWKNVITKQWVKHPILGYGIGGHSFFDAQYPRVLVETGILGMAAFLWLIYSLLTNVLETYRKSKDRFYKGLALGFLAGLVAMLTHAISANTFIIVRIMEPFWFLAGIVVMLPVIEMRERQESV
ncbi:MAG: O-antigen ligase family protein [Thermodesulfobacteriota bacterium]